MMMKQMTRNAVAAVAVAAATVLVLSVQASASPRHAAEIDWNAVSQAMGIPVSAQSGGVYRIDIPRSDLAVTLQEPPPRAKRRAPKVPILPSFALGGYLVFLPTSGGTQAMMMGDLVLTESEIEPVMLKLVQSGVDITAIHNHLLWLQPAVMYMHVMGAGNPAQLAKAVHDALALTRTPLRAQPSKPSDQQVDLDTASLDAAIGAAGKVSGGVYKFSIPPAFSITSDGMTIPPSMGLSTALAFQPLGEGSAAITGDFVLLGGQVNPVLRALRANGILVTALHSHVLDATPPLFFMHFYASGIPVVLAGGLRAALDALAAHP